MSPAAQDTVVQYCCRHCCCVLFFRGCTTTKFSVFNAQLRVTLSRKALVLPKNTSKVIQTANNQPVFAQRFPPFVP